MTPNVLCLDLEPRADLPDFQAPRWLGKGVSWVSVKASRESIPRDSLAYSHIILSGSTYSITQDDPVVEPAVALVRDAVRRRVPLLGICYGHQLIARALLGRDHVRHAASPEMGWLPVSCAPSGRDWFQGLPNPFHVFMGHFDEVCNLPADWEVIASTPKCAVQAVVNPKLRFLGLQFHPEMDLPIGNRCFQADAEPLAKHGFDVDAIVRTARNDGSGAVLIPRFLGHVWPD